MFRLFSVVTFSMFVLLCGCGRSLPETADPVDARHLLESTLLRWQQGVSAKALTEDPEPTYIADEDWHNGYRLNGFLLDPDSRLVGFALRCDATLTLEDLRGKPLERNVTYVVATDPVRSIVRLD